jgi:S-DNA-T family DNA segregation ATPase FtsK/SpoIIIE
MKHKQYLNVICPMCGAFKNKECKHTSKAKKGKTRKEPHEDRVMLAKVKLSDKIKKDISSVEEKPKKKNPHEKLTVEQKAVVAILIEKIEVLGKHAEFVGPVSQGPLIDTYRFLPTKRTKVAHLEQLHKDFAVALGAESVLVKRMPGESAIGVFIPRKDRKKVLFGDTLSNVSDYMKQKPEDGHSVIPLNLGIDSNGDPAVDDLTQQPHVLIAGATGSGKSTAQHAIALSMLFEMSPDRLKIIISDTKGVEFKAFAHMPHLQFPICTNVYNTMEAMNWCVKETQKRLNLFAEADVRNIHEYNERTVSDGKLPYIVIFIDELADVIAEGPEVDRGEAKVNASKLGTIVARSRASGIHVIAATQRPSVNIVKGSIKSNFPTRLAFKLPSSVDSRTVLQTKGAEALMKRGDGLYSSSTSSDLRRIHAPYTSLDELKTTVECIIQRHSPTVEGVLGKTGDMFGKESMYKQPN